MQVAENDNYSHEIVYNNFNMFQCDKATKNAKREMQLRQIFNSGLRYSLCHIAVTVYHRKFKKVKTGSSYIKICNLFYYLKV